MRIVAFIWSIWTWRDSSYPYTSDTFEFSRVLLHLLCGTRSLCAPSGVERAMCQCMRDALLPTASNTSINM